MLQAHPMLMNCSFLCEHDHEKQQLLLLGLDPALPPTCSRELPPASCNTSETYQ